MTRTPAGRATRASGLDPRPLIVLAIVLAAAGSAAAEEAGPDTTRWRVEAGVTSDFTNEQFYEDAFVDSISLGRRLVSTPEARTAGVLAATWDGTRGQRATRYALGTEVSLGDKLQREAVHFTLRAPVATDWRLTAVPRAEYRRDRTFDRDLEEWRGSVHLRATREAFAGVAPELGLDGDFLRSSGDGADFLPDRDAGRVTVGVGSAAWSMSEWRLGYGLAVRGFPDSTERDHLEHGLDTRWHRELGDLSLGVEAAAQRRSTRRPAPSTRDNFWDGQAALDLDLRTGSSWTWRLKLAGEGMRYDVDDSTLYFDYGILRARLTPRCDRGAWNVAFGPRVEELWSRTNSSEEYVEYGGLCDLEYLGRGFWTFSPVVGRRAYRAESSRDPFSVVAVHSDYTFYEISLFADQPIGGGVRIRALGSGRYEQHTDAADDARSLYFSLDLRRLF